MPAKKHSSSRKSTQQMFERKTHREHVLLRPDTVIGSIIPVDTLQYILKSSQIIPKEMKISHGFLKIFDEILVNASDQVSRTLNTSKASLKVNNIKVWVDRKTGQISVWNNGMGVPVEMHKKEKMWIVELIFGVMLTGQNFDDSEKRTTGGKNGYGAKLANIFSKQFTVRTTDQKSRQTLEMTWYDNMIRHDEAIITPYDPEDKDAFVGTMVTFTPDYERFNMKGLTQDMVALLQRRSYDIAACTPEFVKMSFNDKRIPVKSIKDYAALVAFHKREEGEVRVNSYIEKGNRWKVVLGLSDGNGLEQISFVNGIHTLHGGTHVDHIVSQLTKYIQTVMEKMPEFKEKSSKHSVKISDIKKHLQVVMSAVIENPDFDSQSKETLKTPPENFGSNCKMSTTVMKRIVTELNIIERIKDVLFARNMKNLQKGSNTKKNRLFGIPKLEDANQAGTRKSAETMLFITEGDSAASMVRAGLSVIGRDRYGIFPLRGKLLNVRTASSKDTSKNAEIQNLIKILGLRFDMGKTYDAETIKTLRYGSLCILTDQDHDGSHIKGLVINFLHMFFPSLLKIPGFVKFFITPICKVTRSKQIKSFYTYDDMDKWFESNNQGSGWKIKFYKGLGTSTSAEAKEYFGNLPKHLINFTFIDNKSTKDCLELAFKKELADKRKTWVNQLNAMEEQQLEYNPETGMSYNDFIDNELILFSIADNIRSIPSAIDGLKPSQRKVLFGSMTRKSRSDDIKVSQLAGDISLRMAYHHGEASLVGTIIGMAQDFTGANNINQLYPSGQFGSRVMGGKDHASARYIFTHVNDIVDTLYHPDDMPLLNYNVDDGDKVEPSIFVPIIPMLLVNGSSGIGTGYSCTVPSFNPEDIVTNLKLLMDNKKQKSMLPWYHDNQSTITKKDNKYISRGIFERRGDKSIYISELPVGMWTQTYKEKLMKKMEGKTSALKNINEYSTERVVGFELEFQSKAHVDKLIASGDKAYKLLDLEKSIQSNLHCFANNGKIKKFKDVNAILEEFYKVRFQMYTQRRLYQLILYGRTIKILENKLRYLREVIDGKLTVFKKSKKFREEQLKERGYDKFDLQADLTHEDFDSRGTYQYLTSMPIDAFGLETIERLEKELQKFKDKYSATDKTNEIIMWNSDLEQFLDQYRKFRDEQTRIVEEERSGKFKKTIQKKTVRKRRSKLVRGDTGSVLQKKKARR